VGGGWLVVKLISPLFPLYSSRSDQTALSVKSK